MPSTLISRIVVIASEGSITTRVECLVLLMVSFVGIRPKFDFASDRTLVSKIEIDSVRIEIESGEIYPIAMVVETRRGKRKDNPTEEEAPRVKFAKTGSGENVEKTTTEESETRAVEIVELTAKTTDESTAKTTDVSTEKTTDVSTEKTRKDSTENTAEITEPSNVAVEAAPTTLSKGPGDEENEETASGDEENEGSEEEQEKPDGKNESSNEENEDSEEEPLDGENEVNARSEEEEANGEREEEANENGNPPEPQDIDSIIPTRTPQEERLLDDILEDEDEVDESDIVVDSWEKCLDACYKVFFQDMHDEDVAACQKQAEASEAAPGDGIEVSEQSIQLGDVMKLLKRTMKLMRTVDKKIDQLDGRLAPLEEFVKEAQAKTAEEEAQAKAAEEEAPAQGKAKKQKRRKK
ncbi:hypothetical protein DY000_02059651 [Brassica cretica]|uniref:DUF287 domain-containing protein n=1 Tax=Brassica cretica TaxID=69181 RepID=A0ABQ7ATC7_BRACR|nr:hypothetical protein DY000_02059651 [Brassica cretica]